MHKIKKKEEYSLVVSPPLASGDDLTEEIRSCLIEQAMGALKNSYAPYSHYLVGTAVLCGSGKIYTGVNVENAAYPAGVCAEKVAFASAVTNGEKEFVAAAVVGGEQIQVIPTPPCGICRQFMYELGGPELTIITAADEDHFRLFKMSELLPEGFTLNM